MSYLEISHLVKTWNDDKKNKPFYKRPHEFSDKPEQKESQDFSIDFSCSLEKGLILGIAGQSGSGKSTVLRLISGLLESDDSRIRVDGGKEFTEKPKILLDGKDISKLPPAKRGIGMVFQTPALFPHLRVDDNVAYGLRYGDVSSEVRLSKKEARKYAAEYLDKFNMKDLAERFPDSLSGGEAQRVSLARTLIMNPSLILFDEPFSALDAPLRKKLAKEIKQLQIRTGFTGILVTHDINEIKAMCDAVTVLYRGKQIWTGDPKDFCEELLLGL
ncbi:ABC transporter ATP-binding protein [Treponema parvum]|uniref:ABC transporter ATP-binding protein n=1 Tax=Treponema parvum TaxID=138851 RepID=UPI001AEC4739|nr:ABC transporter ATP-binding protein [Treponema parvum]QTQ15840.1 ABC transporter ATP-binding protein [Treponema parvum]